MLRPPVHPLPTGTSRTVCPLQSCKRRSSARCWVPVSEPSSLRSVSRGDREESAGPPTATEERGLLDFPGYVPAQRGAALHIHLEEVALGFSGKRAGVELAALVVPVLVDHSEGGWTAMGRTTRGAGRRGGGPPAGGFRFADSREGKSYYCETENTTRLISEQAGAARAAAAPQSPHFLFTKCCITIPQ